MITMQHEKERRVVVGDVSTSTGHMESTENSTDFENERNEGKRQRGKDTRGREREKSPLVFHFLI